jgi:putative glutathione S-transferase
MVVRDSLISPSLGAFSRPPSEFLATVVPPGEHGEFVAEPGRYHLFLSDVCPWANSVRAARHVMGLQEVISVDIADGQSGLGWVFLSGATCAPWVGRPGAFYLHEVYQTADTACTSRITVPVLWDTRMQRIVCNDSWQIVKLLATSFRALCACPLVDLFPPELRDLIEDTHTQVYKGLLNGVYMAGVNLVKGNMPAYEAACQTVYATLDGLESKLMTCPFLCGPHLTAVDLRVVMTLLRFDAAYYRAFGLDRVGRGGEL